MWRELWQKLWQRLGQAGDLQEDLSGLVACYTWSGPRHGRGHITGPHRLVAKDTTLSRWRHGFESRWGCHGMFA